LCDKARPLRLIDPVAVAHRGSIAKLVHNAFSDLCNLEGGVFPELGARQDVVYALEKGRRKLVVIGPGDG